MKRVITPSLIAAVLLLSACDKSSTMEDINSTDVAFPNGIKVKAETMHQEIDLTRGLMFRDALQAGRGMLFIYPNEAQHKHWMYQVKFPIDTIWMDRERNITEIAENMKPCENKAAHECPQYGGLLKSRYALEVPAGFVAQNHVRVGQTLEF